MNKLSLFKQLTGFFDWLHIIGFLILVLLSVGLFIYLLYLIIDTKYNVINENKCYKKDCNCGSNGLCRNNC